MEDNFSEEVSNHRMSLLEKINVTFILKKKERNDLKEKKKYNEINLLFVKTSSDELIISFVNKLLTDPERPGQVTTSSNAAKNIGLKVIHSLIKKTMKYLENEKTSTVTKINVFDYNYLLSKKFKYMKNQAILFADYYIFVINIYDKVNQSDNV